MCACYDDPTSLHNLNSEIRSDSSIKFLECFKFALFEKCTVEAGRVKRNGSRRGSLRAIKRTNATSSTLKVNNQWRTKLLGQVFVCRLPFYEDNRAWGQWRRHYRYPLCFLFSFDFLRLSFFFCCLTRPSYHKKETNCQLESEKVCGWWSQSASIVSFFSGKTSFVGTNHVIGCPGVIELRWRAEAFKNHWQRTC